MITKQSILLKIQIVILISFVLVKFIARPYVLKEFTSKPLTVFVLSYPNFCEAVLGVLILSLLLLLLDHKIKVNMHNQFIYFIACFLTAAYTILQEFKIHNLGGVNVYDINDVIFSIIGVIFGYCLLCIIKPKTLS